ncbi:MAG: primosomal protein N' [Clostridia bacterium]|nr:primosomal protein N' [Clostridia bacterium]
MWKVEMRLLNALYTYDRPWTYLSDTPCEIGMIGAIPFGKADRWQYGVVTAVEEGEEEGLKSISFFLPDPYRLSRHHTELAHFMADRFYCSFGDCARIMLPSGLNFKTEVYYEKGESFETLSSDDPVYLLLCDKDSDFLEGVEKDRLSSLLRHGIIVKRTRAVCTVNEKLETVVSLSKSFSRADLPTLLKGCRKKEEYERVVSYLEGVEDSVPARVLSEIYSVKQDALKYLERKGVVTLSSRRVMREPYDLSGFKRSREDIILSDEQTRAYNTLLPLLEACEPSAALLYGITGSGKTSVILKLIDKAIENGQGVILLVPEIALTLQNASKLFSRYGERVAVIHSAMSEGQRQDAWEALESGEKTVVLGTRSAVFAPVKNLGLIVIDEEQDDSYKSDISPRYHARDVARFRCAKSGALMLLASATPDVDSFWRAKNGKYTLVELTERYGGATLPDITLYDTVSEGLPPDTMIGDVLEKKLAETLSRGEQAILFLNRRGLRKLLVCRDCKSGVSCPNCSVPMTLHLANGEYKLACHWCGYRQSPPMTCPECHSEHMQYRGYGTEKLEEEIKRKFPTARVLRMDADTTGKKFSHDEIINEFSSHSADILIGTQMVTKGHNFPDVTLVGVIMADLSMFVSDYRACEHTFALLTQVVGRAGRGDKNGTAVIQTMDAGGEIINLCTTQDYEGFYKGEIALRQALLFPPFCSVGMFFLTGENERELEKASEKLNGLLSGYLKGEFADVKIIAYGPFEAFPYKLKNRYRRKLIVKYKNTARARALFHKVLHEFTAKDNIHCIFDPNPSGV